VHRDDGLRHRVTGARVTRSGGFFRRFLQGEGRAFAGQKQSVAFAAREETNALVELATVGRMRTLAKEPGRQNVEVVSADLVAMSEATQPADVLWLHLFYHDLHTTLIQARGATATRFNQAVYERLKPGGSYVIVDHAAAVGAGTSDAQSLHRIDPASVREEVEAAGFVLDAESTLLADKDDQHSIKVFDSSIKGQTDRFAYRFVKP